MFLVSLGVVYLIFSLLAGIILTFTTWEKGNTHGFITFALCTLCFAAIWPLVAVATFTERK